MPVTPGFRAFVLEQLEYATRDIRWREMFGGVGIYAGEDFFALIANDVVYFKVDAETRPKFEARGMGPFRPYGEKGEVMQYYQVDAALLEDPDALRPWIADAVAVARRARTRPRRGRPSQARSR